MTTKHRMKAMVGRVVSDKMDKTVIVAVESRYRHRLYKKILRRTRKYKVHNEGNTAKAGDSVKIVETRPLSKEKRWRVAEIITRCEVVELPPEVLEAPPIEKIEPVSVKEEPAKEEAATATPPPEGTPPAVAEEKAPSQ